MKLALICLFLFATVACVLGEKDAICNQQFARNGDGLIACQAYMPSFSYDADKNECISFVYGGCGGNDNRFRTLAECESKCKN